ncbi:DUF3987 domain-containing protein [Streptosporangium soli]|nr:DUF3987 domain-containing protein [Streptosporangium sp. KLBMP 9127]
MTGPTRADLARVGEWLTTLHGGSPGLISIFEAETNRSETFATDEPGVAAAAEFVGRLDAQGKKGIYARCTTLREAPSEGKRGSAELSLAFPGFWADIDIVGPGHKHEVCSADCTKTHKQHITLPLPPDYEAAKQVIAESGLPEPSLIIHSGGGIYPWWLLAQPHLVDDVGTLTALSSRWQHIIKAAAERLGYAYGEGVGNLDRVLRIPGTINRKAGLSRPCDIVEWPNARYQLDELGGIAHDIELPEPARHAPPKQGFTGPPPRTRTPFTAPGSVGPFDALGEAAEWRDLLEPAGFSYVRSERDGAELWKYSGSSADSEYSVRCGYNGVPVAVNHSESTPLPSGAGQKLTMGRLFAHLYYRGDERAAGQDLRAAAAGDPTASSSVTGLPISVLDHIRQRCNIPPWVNQPPPARSEQATHDLYNLAGQQPPTAAPPSSDQATPPAGEQANPEQDAPTGDQQQTSGPDVRVIMGAAAEAEVLQGVFTSRDQLAAHPWSIPGSDTQPTQLPPFPTHTLPGDLGKFAEAVATYCQVPADVVAFAMLGALAALIGGYATVNGQWRERSLNLYIASLMDSGEGKSRAFAEITPPVYALEREQRQKWDKDFGDNAEALQVAQATREKVIKDLSTAQGSKRNDLLADLDTVKETIKALTGPARPQFLVGDVTLEALGQVMHRQGGHIGHISSEGTLLGVALGRYSKGAPNVDLLLEALDSSPYRLDRTGREPFEIERASLSVSLSVQPVVIAEALGNIAVTERGLLNRFLFSRPESLAGRRDSKPPRVPNHLSEAWSYCVRTAFYVVLPDGDKYDDDGDLKPPVALQVSDDAEALHLEWRRHLELRVDPDTGDLAALKGWLSRLTGTSIRIAALLHLAAGYRPSQPIHENTMLDALTIADYCIEHAIAVLGAAQRREGTVTEQPAQNVLAWIRRKGIGEFTVQDVSQGLKGRKWMKDHGAQGARAVLVSLAAQGWLASVARSGSDGRRLGDGLFVSHPTLLESAA